MLVGDASTGSLRIAEMIILFALVVTPLSTIALAVLIVPMLLASSIFGMDTSWLNSLYDDSWLGVDWFWVIAYLPWVIFYGFGGCAIIKRKFGRHTLPPFG